MRKPPVGRLISGILNALYPSTCPSCSSRSDNLPYSPFCSACWSTIHEYTGGSCRVCSNPFASESSGVCGSCIKEPPPFSRAMSFGLYDSVLAKAIHAFKFQKIKRLHRPLGTLMLTADLPTADAIVPVPLSSAGLRERGFNQALLLAKVIASGTGTPLMTDGLVKKTDTPPQIGLTAAQRASNLKGAFSADRDFSGLTVLLVDDVMTTGATARACSHQLRRAGAEKIIVYTLARAVTL